MAAWRSCTPAADQITMSEMLTLERPAEELVNGRAATAPPEQRAGGAHGADAERRRYRELSGRPEGYVVTDALGTIRECNRAARPSSAAARTAARPPLSLYSRGYRRDCAHLARLQHGDAVQDRTAPAAAAAADPDLGDGDEVRDSRDDVSLRWLLARPSAGRPSRYQLAEIVESPTTRSSARRWMAAWLPERRRRTDLRLHRPRDGGPPLRC